MFLYRIGGRPVAGQPARVGDNAPAVGLEAGSIRSLRVSRSEGMLSCATSPEERALQGPF